jgi:hypothetical protein
MATRRTLATLIAVAIGLGAAAQAHAATQIGVAAAVRGNVQVLRAPAVGTALQSGAKLYLGDKVSTGPDAGLQIMLLDETVFTLGPGSELTLDTFVYDPATADGKVDAKLVKGAFRFISGRVARKDPRKMTVALPSGTIGIRGTIVYARVDSDQGSATVVLAGPGDANTTGEPAGAIDVTNSGVTQEVLRSGWGVEIAGHDQPPSDPFPAPEGFFESFEFEVAAPVANTTASSDEGPGDEDSASESSSSEAPAAPESSTEAGADEPSSESSPASASGAQLETASIAVQADGVLLDSLANVELPIPDPETPITPPPTTTPPIVNPPSGPVFTPTLVSELAALAETFSGNYIYDALDQPLPNGGSFDLSVNLDFPMQQIIVTLKDVNSPFLGITSSGAGMGTASTSFEGQFPEARYDVNLDYADSPAGCAATCQANVQFFLENQDATTAALLSGTVSITKLGQNMPDTGAVNDVPFREVVP